MKDKKDIQNAEKQTPKRKKKNSVTIFVALIVVSALVLTLGVYITIRSITIGANSAEVAYQEDMENSKEKARKEKEEYAYRISYDVAEANNHVKNRVVLQLGNVREKADLEVLEVSGSEIIIEKANDNLEKDELWLEVIAKGVYTVDLTCAEFIFDAENQHVWARVPKPIMDRKHFTTVSDKQLLYKNDKFLANGSIAAGENLVVSMRQEGAEKIYQSVVSNQEYYENAESSAKMLISNLIKELNPEFDNLNVEVQFTE
ncbi:MAG: hypothetical protein Q4D51_10945 [Eubacteriales bacterium]|nr:hypothetical protein [Eubacteriales bacterium]